MQNLEINEETYKELKKLYKDNELYPNRIITYRNHKIVIKYLKYVLEHYENENRQDHAS